MPELMTQYSASHLLNMLKEQGLTADTSDAEDFILSQREEKGLPLYVRILSGIGAFIASICLISFLGAAKIISMNSYEGLIFWGIIFVVISVVVKAISGDDDTAGRSFLVQVSFSFIMIGKILFASGFVKMIDSPWSITLALLISTIATYKFYDMPTERFLSSLALLLSIFFSILRDEYGVMLNMFFIAQMAAAAFLFTSTKAKKFHDPLKYAFIFSICTVVLYVVILSKRFNFRDFTIVKYIDLIMIAGLTALTAWVAGGIGKLKKEPLVIALAVIALLGLLKATGILLVIGLFILGYAKHERPLIITGALFMPVFLFFYYYEMQVTLLAKSGILVGSGAILLAGRAYLKLRKLDTVSAEAQS